MARIWPVLDVAKGVRRGEITLVGEGRVRRDAHDEFLEGFDDVLDGGLAADAVAKCCSRQRIGLVLILTFFG